MNIHPKPPEIPTRDANPWWRWLQEFVEQSSTSALGEISTHANATSVHSATAAPIADRIILRDAAGRAQVAAPSAAVDIARLDTVTVHATLNVHKYARSFMLMGG